MEKLPAKLEVNQRPTERQFKGLKLSHWQEAVKPALPTKKRAKQSMANLAIQQQLRYSLCRMEHDILQCLKEQTHRRRVCLRQVYLT